MLVKVRLFAGLRERAGAADRELEGVTRVSEVWPALGLGDEPDGLLYAVNRRYAEREQELADGDEVALIPPVSAPHRHDALAACKDAIDTLKQTVPLWKKEVYEGGEEWLGRGS